MNKLQHIYDKHAHDFGLSGTRNAEQLQKLSDAIYLHLRHENTAEVRGWYRGQQASLFLNTETNNVVVTDTSGDLIAAYKASEAQAAYIQSTGRLN